MGAQVQPAEDDVQPSPTGGLCSDAEGLASKCDSSSLSLCAASLSLEPSVEDSGFSSLSSLSSSSTSSSKEASPFSLPSDLPVHQLLPDRFNAPSQVRVVDLVKGFKGHYYSVNAEEATWNGPYTVLKCGLPWIPDPEDRTKNVLHQVCPQSTVALLVLMVLSRIRDSFGNSFRVAEGLRRSQTSGSSFLDTRFHLTVSC